MLMYEMNSDIHEYTKKLAKKINKLSRKYPNRMESIMRGVKLDMEEDIIAIIQFFNDCLDVPMQDGSMNVETIHKNARIVTINECASKAIDNVINDMDLDNNVKYELKIALISDVCHFISEGEVNRINECINQYLIKNGHINNEPVDPIENTDESVDTAVVEEETESKIDDDTTTNEVDDTAKCVEDVPADDKKKVKRSKKRLSVAEIHMISKVLSENANATVNDIITLLSDKGLDIAKTTLTNVKYKISGKDISDQYFKIDTDEKGNKTVVPVNDECITIDEFSSLSRTDVDIAKDKIRQSIGKKKARGELLSSSELEFLVKDTSYTVKSATVPMIYNYLKKHDYGISFAFIEHVISGEINELPIIDIYRGETNDDVIDKQKDGE